MIGPLLPRLNALRVVLASTSPRRKELLSTLGVEFSVCGSSFAEDLDKALFESPAAYVAATARHKAVEVARRLEEQSPRPGLVVAADTVVVLDGVILEKPRDAGHARDMLRALSGRVHEVVTGVVLLRYSERAGEYAVSQFTEQTRVRFATLPEDVISEYVSTGEPMDKAGYGIQGRGGALVAGIEGCYFNVVGFPVHRFCVEACKLLGHT